MSEPVRPIRILRKLLCVAFGGLTSATFLRSAPAEAEVPVPSATVAEVGNGDSANTAARKPAEPEPEKEPGYTFDGSFVEEYRLRIASHALPARGALGDTAQENWQRDQHLRLLSDAEFTGMDEHLRVLASGALWLDLDGPSPRGAESFFATQYDNANPWVSAYELSAEWQKDKALDHLRVGRQSTQHGMPLTFDGLSVGLRVLERKLSLFGFGGRTVHFFETKPGLLENWVASTGATYRPTRESSIELDTRIIQEQVLNSDRSRRDRITNHSYGLVGSLHRESAFGKLYVRGVDQWVSHAGGAFQYEDNTRNWGVDAKLSTQLVTLGEIVESENAFFSLLGPSLPNARYRMDAWKSFTLGERTRLGLHLGWRGRNVIGHSEQAFNRNTGGVYFLARVDDLFRRGLFLSGTAEWNYVPRSPWTEGSLALGGSMGYAPGDIKTELGSYFQQYKIYYYQQADELHNARTVYASLSYRLASYMELRARYEVDIVDRYLQTLGFSARQDF